MMCLVAIFVTLIASGASAIAQTAAPTTSTKTETPTTSTQEKTSKPEEKSPKASAPQGSCNWYSPIACASEAVGLFQFFKLENILELFFRILYIFTDLILGNLVRLSSWLFELSLNLVVNSDMDLVEVGWNESLKIANSLFILIFLGMAISIILGISSFGKARLPQFIMVILLINFSMVIGLVIINFSNSLTQTFSDAISQKPRESGQQAIQSIIASEPVDKFAQSTTNITTRLNGTEPLKLSNDEDSGFLTKIGDSTKEGKSVFFDNLATLLFKFISKIFTYLLLIFVFLAGAVYMITRTFWLWLLLMISPLAWIAFLIPSLEKHWKSWWEQFIKWNIFAPAYLFFLFLGMKIAEASPSLGVSSLADAFQPDILIQSLIVGFVMLAGLSISSKLGVGGSNFVMNYADSAKKEASKKFKEIRGKSEWSAENIGKKFGAAGARITAPLGITERGKRVQERYALEKMEAEEKERKKEQVGGLYNLRGQLSNINKFESESLAFAIESGMTSDQLREYRTELRNRRLKILQNIRTESGEGKNLKKKLEDLAKEEGIIKEEGKDTKQEKKEEKAKEN